MDGIAHLDTHVVIWLCNKNLKPFSKKALDTIETYQLLISPIVILELQYLFEKKITPTIPQHFIKQMKNDMGLKIGEDSFETVTKKSLEIKWTRDPFDRIITAQASLEDEILLTKDKLILKHYKNAIWN
jgi:PIN domain nuclease of toxin-antitoxin system